MPSRMCELCPDSTKTTSMMYLDKDFVLSSCVRCVFELRTMVKEGTVFTGPENRTEPAETAERLKSILENLMSRRTNLPLLFTISSKEPHMTFTEPFLLATNGHDPVDRRKTRRSRLYAPTLNLYAGTPGRRRTGKSTDRLHPFRASGRGREPPGGERTLPRDQERPEGGQLSPSEATTDDPAGFDVYCSLQNGLERSRRGRGRRRKRGASAVHDEGWYAFASPTRGQPPRRIESDRRRSLLPPST